MKISSVIALFVVIYLSHSDAASNFTAGQFGAGHEPQNHVSVKPMSVLRSWLRPKKTTDAGRIQTSRPTVHPSYTTQSRPVNRYSTRRSNFKMGPLYNFIFRKQSTVQSGQMTTPRGVNPLTTEIKRAYQTTEHAVSLGRHGASTGHNFVTARHNEIDRSRLVMRDTNAATTKSHPATSGRPTATTARRNATTRDIGTSTAFHDITTEKSTSLRNRTSDISKPQNSTFELDVTFVNQISTGVSECTSFICDDGHTLTGDSFVCDGVDDCTDGSDEIDADGNNCSDTKTLCWGGICINRYMQEVFAKYCEPTPQPDVEVTTTVCLSDSDYLCANKAQCVSVSDLCDGEADCDDGSDESACPCGGFQCGNGKCISATAACNGVDDCGDSSDESSPSCSDNTNGRSCGDHFASGRFHCNNGYCVEKSSVCDGVSDCGDQTDENDALCNIVTEAPVVGSCGPSHYVCSNQNCVTNDKICDDSDDCGDNSDEDFCNFNTGSEFAAPALVYSLAGAGGLILLIFLVTLIAHCHKRKTPTRRAIQRSPVMSMPVPPPSYEESRTNTQHNGVSFENPLSELKARF